MGDDAILHQAAWLCRLAHDTCAREPLALRRGCVRRGERTEGTIVSEWPSAIYSRTSSRLHIFLASNMHDVSSLSRGQWRRTSIDTSLASEDNFICSVDHLSRSRGGCSQVVSPDSLREKHAAENESPCASELCVRCFNANADVFRKLLRRAGSGSKAAVSRTRSVPAACALVGRDRRFTCLSLGTGSWTRAYVVARDETFQKTYHARYACMKEQVLGPCEGVRELLRWAGVVCFLKIHSESLNL